jgi:hypothetical protein
METPLSKMFCLSAGDSSGCNSNCRIEDKIDFAPTGLILNSGIACKTAR